MCNDRTSRAGGWIRGGLRVLGNCAAMHQEVHQAGRALCAPVTLGMHGEGGVGGHCLFQLTTD